MSSVLLSFVCLERFHRLYVRALFCAKKRAAVDTFQPVNTPQADEAPHDAAFFKLCGKYVSLPPFSFSVLKTPSFFFPPYSIKQ